MLLKSADAVKNLEAVQFKPHPSEQVRDKANEVMDIIAERAKKTHIDPAIFGSKASVINWCENPDDPDHPLNNTWRSGLLALTRK